MAATQWSNLKSKLKADAACEDSRRPHVPQERAKLFSSIDKNTTEIDFLDLLHGIVRATKPNHILETGTYRGASAAAMAFALQENHYGHLCSIEQDVRLASEASALLESIGLGAFATVETSDSIDYIENRLEGRQFEMVYFDSSRRTRPQEFRALMAKGALLPGCILVFHDTSIHLDSTGAPSERLKQTEYLAEIARISSECQEHISFQVSRGVTLLKMPG